MYSAHGENYIRKNVQLQRDCENDFLIWWLYIHVLFLHSISINQLNDMGNNDKKQISIIRRIYQIKCMVGNIRRLPLIMKWSLLQIVSFNHISQHFVFFTLFWIFFCTFEIFLISECVLIRTFHCFARNTYGVYNSLLTQCEYDCTNAK